MPIVTPYLAKFPINIYQNREEYITNLWLIIILYVEIWELLDDKNIAAKFQRKVDPFW